jgi:hypothetical protein
VNKRGNTSSAVMQQRNKPRNDGLDDFPTPPWATRALIEHVLAPPVTGLDYFKDLSVWEPACNRGYMALALSQYFGRGYNTDVKDYEWAGQQRVEDFLMPFNGNRSFDWIITNPPFRLAAQFARRCLDLNPREGFALLVRTSFLEGIERYNTLFSQCPPATIAQFAERVPMVEGRCDPDASTATSYCWLVWDSGARFTPEFVWIPPCRRALERLSDYTWENDNG